MSRLEMKKRSIKNFILGFGSILNIFPKTEYRKSSSFLDDKNAMMGDWEKIGEDFSKAIENFERQKTD